MSVESLKCTEPTGGCLGFCLPLPPQMQPAKVISCCMDLGLCGLLNGSSYY